MVKYTATKHLLPSAVIGKANIQPKEKLLSEDDYKQNELLKKPAINSKRVNLKFCHSKADTNISHFHIIFFPVCCLYT